MKIFHDTENSVMFTFIHNDIQTKKLQILHIHIQHHREKDCCHHIYYLNVFGFVASDYFMNRHHQSDGKQNYFNYREVHFRFFSIPQYYKNKI